MDDKWVRNVRESPAAIAARELSAVLGDVGAPDENVASDLAKVRRQVERIVWVLDNCDPYLVPQTALDQANQALVAARQLADQYSAAQDPTQLAAAMAQTEATLVHLGTAAIPAESASPIETIANVGRTVSEQLEAAGRQMTSVVEQLSTRVAAVDQQRLASEQQGTEIASKLEQLAADLEAMRQSAASLTSSWQTSFTEEQATRAEQFRTLLEEQRTQGTTALAALDTNTTASLTRAQADVSAALSVLDEQKVRAEEIVGIISDEALIGEPSKRAAESKRAAFWWSLGAVVFGAAASAMAVVAILDHSSADSDSDWFGFALRALGVLAIGGVGAYAAREANEHRRAQRDLEHMAVQLAAIKPYLRDMTEGSRDEVLREVAAKLFGPRLADAAKDEDLALPAGTLQLVQVLVKALQTK